MMASSIDVTQGCRANQLTDTTQILWKTAVVELSAC